MSELKSHMHRLGSFRALSLVEVCIAIAILSISLVSLSGIFNQGYRLLRKTKMSGMARFLAQEKMEQFLHNSTINPGVVNYSETMAAPYQDFSGMVNVTYPASGEGTNATVDGYLARINVTIFWQGEFGQQNYSLTSLVNNLSH